MAIRAPDGANKIFAHSYLGKTGIKPHVGEEGKGEGGERGEETLARGQTEGSTSVYIRRKVARIGPNRPKFCILYAK